MRAPTPSARPLMVLIALLAVSAVGFAVYSQHQWNMQPCPWCILQRVIFLAIALVATLAALVGTRAAALGACLLVLAASASGVASALWQHFVAAKTNSCNLTLADKIISGLQLDRALPEIFEVRGTCADAAVNLWGLPYEFWSLGLFVLLAILAVAAVRRPAA